jgi:3-hydroxyisobutyrate dehydrogenase
MHGEQGDAALTDPTDSAVQTVGYIGLGIMGAPMAGNLLAAGYDVVVWNRTPTKARPLVEQGAVQVKTPAELAARRPDVICINVTDTADVEAVLFGETGIASGAKKGLIVVDHSTISPRATQQFAERLEAMGVTLIDAPVSGGDTGAKQGSLSIMVGGPDEAVARVTPMLEVVGKQITHLGPAGAGQACKACNQVAVACNLAGACEALALAKQTGLDLDKMIEVVGAGAGGSWQLSNLGPKIAAGDDAPGFMIDLVLKDLAIVAETARDRQLPMAATESAADYFRAAAALGHGQAGTQAMARALEALGAFAKRDHDPQGE